MVKAFKITVAGAAMAMAALSLAASAQAGNGSAVGAGLAGRRADLHDPSRRKRRTPSLPGPDSEPLPRPADAPPESGRAEPSTPCPVPQSAEPG